MNKARVAEAARGIIQFENYLISLCDIGFRESVLCIRILYTIVLKNLKLYDKRGKTCVKKVSPASAG